ncbi:MAG: LemA family protein [Bacillota bacterium]|nr:LemA family protein [Bacillota bacterium]
MGEIVLVFLGIVLVLVIISIAVYNGLVRRKINVSEAWSGIDVQLKRKGNVLPNLIDTIKMQTNYEGDLLKKLTAARTGITTGSNEERMKVNDEVTKLMPSVYAVAENYPQLGANESFRKIMEQVADCEDKISYARNRYNIAVTTYNTAIKVFPGMVFASIFGFTSENFFEIEETSRRDIDNMRLKDID